MCWLTSILNRSDKPLLLLLGAVMAFMAASCGSASTGGTDSHLGELIYSPSRAEGFEIRHAWPGSESVVITSFNPWQGAEGEDRRLMILRGGESAPEWWKGPVVANGEARRIVCMSSTHVAMLDVAGAADRIAGVSGLKFVSNPSIVSRRAELADPGYDNAIDYEALAAAKPDLVTLYGVDSASAIESKLKELGIPYIYIGEYLETSPTGRAEWLVALAEVAGCRDRGEEEWLKIQASYDSLHSIVERADSDALLERPTVMLNAPYREAWYAPSPESFAVKLINDAGGSCLTVSSGLGNSSMPMALEDAYAISKEADVWLQPGQARSLSELCSAAPRFASAKAVKAGRVFNTTARVNAQGGNDFWESACVMPHKVLSDLIIILHPELAKEGAGLYYYEQLK